MNSILKIGFFLNLLSGFCLADALIDSVSLNTNQERQLKIFYTKVLKLNPDLESYSDYNIKREEAESKLPQGTDLFEQPDDIHFKRISWPKLAVRRTGKLSPDNAVDFLEKDDEVLVLGPVNRHNHLPILHGTEVRFIYAKDGALSDVLKKVEPKKRDERRVRTLSDALNAMKRFKNQHVEEVDADDNKDVQESTSNKILSSKIPTKLPDAFNASDLIFSEPKENQKKKSTIFWGTNYLTPVHNLLDKTTKGNPLVDMKGNKLGVALSTKDWCDAAMEGSLAMVDPMGNIEVYNYAGMGKRSQVDCTKYFRHSPTQRARFKKLKDPFTHPWGEGSYFSKAAIRLVPYRTIAADKKYPIGTVFFIPKARGLKITLPDGALFVHDGYFMVGDRGGLIKDNHFDFFTGPDLTHNLNFMKNKKRFVAYQVNDKAIAKSLLELHGIKFKSSTSSGSK